MTRDEQVAHFNAFVMKMADTMLNKGDDYANKDRLSNFKLAGSITGIGAKLNCLNMIATKVARLGVLLNSSGSPKHESVQDSVLDLACYATLLSQILEDENKVDSEGAG
jgi:hypothetical protein